MATYLLKTCCKRFISQNARWDLPDPCVTHSLLIHPTKATSVTCIFQFHVLLRYYTYMKSAFNHYRFPVNTPRGDRTLDLQIKRLLLYQLSYGHVKRGQLCIAFNDSACAGYHTHGFTASNLPHLRAAISVILI